MNIRNDAFTRIIPKSAIYYVIRVTEENMKRIYNFLKQEGCESYPEEKLAAGQIWLYDPECKDCIAYTDEDFNEIEWLEYESAES